MMDQVGQVLRAKWAERERERKRRDRDAAGMMMASEFARAHKIDPYWFRKRLRRAGVKRGRGTFKLPIKVMEKVLGELT